MQIPILGVTKNDGIIIGMFLEKFLKFQGCVGQIFEPEANIFNNDRCP